MLVQRLLVALLGVAFGASTIISSDPDVQAAISATTIPGAYIVELADAIVCMTLKVMKP